MYTIFLLVLFGKNSWQSSVINQSIFLEPITNSAFIRCPLNLSASSEILWYDVTNQRYDVNRGRTYRIQGSQLLEQQWICSSASRTEEVKFIIRTHSRPLPVRYLTISKITNTTLTVQWKDDQENRYANVTSYELILKYDHLIQSRVLVNTTHSTYTFSSLQSSTFYSIDISVIDIWKRSSRRRTILNQTLPWTSQKKALVNRIIEEDLLEQAIWCYNLQDRLLFIDFNQSNFHMLNQINNLSVFNSDNRMVFTEIVYSSLIYPMNEKNLKYRIQLTISTVQSEYLGKISKACEMYFPFTCSIRLIHPNRYQLRIFNQERQVQTLRPNVVRYRVNQSHFRRRNINRMHQFVHDEITDVKDIYSVVVESDLLDEKLNLSIPCSITRINSEARLSNRTIIIILVWLILVLISLILCIAYHLLFPSRKNSHRKLCNNSVDEKQTDDFGTKAIPVEEFESYVSMMHGDNHLGFSRLFETINESSKSSGFPTKISKLECNKPKNRYADILPYDHSRVKLPKDEYINANYIDGFEKINAYIATQGPMINTINDFWKMVWEKDVGVIVMMTNIEERGNNKCEIYWPERGVKMYGDIEVTFVSVDSLAYYIKRTFAVRCSTNEKFIGSERFVHQFHYIDWPDHGVPLYPLSVLSFIRRSSACHSEIGGPMVVHCSAGVGRTGTYIIIDTMLKKLNERQSLNIPSFLTHIRKQRCNLVQTEEQFIFIYQVLLEAVQLLTIGDSNSEVNVTNIEQQFQLIRRSVEERPMKTSYIHGYYRANEFLITHHPTTSTRNDFWQMIWSNRTTIIVALYTDENLSSDVFNYWPLSNEIIDCGNIHVGLVDEHFECDYIYRDCFIRSTKENDELRVRIISSSYWPDACSPIETSFHLINTIQNLHPHTSIVVHDHSGGYRSATFCALYTMKEQIENEGTVNVYELAKFYYLKRPGIWRNSDDLLFLYRCADILIRDHKS